MPAPLVTRTYENREDGTVIETTTTVFQRVIAPTQIADMAVNSQKQIVEATAVIEAATKSAEKIAIKSEPVSEPIETPIP
jgi:hypothetical protein